MPEVTAWDVKVYLRDQISSLRLQGFTWLQVQNKLGKYAWAVWLMVEKVPVPTPTPPKTQNFTSLPLMFSGGN